MENSTTYNKAQERVEAKQGFYFHLAAFIIVGALLVAVDMSSSPGETWVQWPLMGWGIGMLLHALSVFVFGGASSYTERMMEKELKRHP